MCSVNLIKACVTYLHLYVCSAFSHVAHPVFTLTVSPAFVVLLLTPGTLRRVRLFVSRILSIFAVAAKVCDLAMRERGC